MWSGVIEPVHDLFVQSAHALARDQITNLRWAVDWISEARAVHPATPSAE